MGKNLFNSVQQIKPKKNYFDLSHDVKLTCDMGQLIPIMGLECVPGDKFKISCESLLRFAPLIAPVMHRMNVSMHYFFVPNRILWSGWEDWIVDAPGATEHPYVQYGSTEYASGLLDYFGLPTPDVGETEKISAFQMAAYQCVYNEYYRDQNLVPEVNWKLTAGDNTSNTDLFALRKRAWQHDYFTAALPFAQKGAAVDIPLGDVILKDPIDIDPLDAPRFRDYTGGFTTGDLTQSGVGIQTKAAIGEPLAYDPAGTLETQATTINELRRAMRLQEWLEKNARGGTRYVENILSHFGVHSSDKRLQRPEYITGVKSPVVVSEVLNTTGEDGGLPQGNMAGHALSVTSGNYGKYFCEEHGFIIGVMSIMPLPAYQQGIHRSFLKYNDPFRYFWPSFANIGEQAVELRELYAFNAATEFGYVPRYAEYKYMPSRVAGDFKTSLNYWHLGRIFSGAPALNQTFVECDPGKRIFAVEEPDVNSLYVHVLNKVGAIRPMPKFGTPTL